MKTLTPKQPNYDDLKRKLKGVRLKKIIDFKDYSKKNNSKSILERNDRDRKLSNISYDHKKCLITKNKLKKKLKFDKLPATNFLL